MVPTVPIPSVPARPGSHCRGVVVIVPPLSSFDPIIVEPIPALRANEEEVVTLTAEAFDPDGEIALYRWSFTDATPALKVGENVVLFDTTLEPNDTPEVQFTAPDVDAPSTLTLRLVVTDNEGATASDELSVTVTPNQPPVADAGADQQTDEGQTVVLSAAASTDADDEITGYAWTQLSGPTAELTEADSAVASFVAPEVEADSELVFQVTVTDARGGVGAEYVERGRQALAAIDRRVLPAALGKRDVMYADHAVIAHVIKMV